MSDNDALRTLGWTQERSATELQQDNEIGRVAVEHRGAYVLYTAAGELWAEISGRLRHASDGRGELPAVGDWVAVRRLPGEDRGVIHAVLPRRTAFSRKVAGSQTEEQVLAANIDFVWLIGALTRELSARRMERYMATAWDSGAQPVVVLTKADLAEASAERIAEVEAIAVGAPVHVTSAVSGEGVEALAATLAGYRTAALLGSSGVGKSTLINRLLGSDRLDVGATRGDDMGRHTTTHRELVVLPSGGLVIDTPGLRELMIWEADTDATFGDITVLASSCRFDDCSHGAEPGCAVREALASGELELERYRSFEKMQRELAYVEGRRQGRPNAAAKRRNKTLTKAIRQRRKLGIDRKR